MNPQELFRELGLNKYESLAYSALLRLGSSTANAIAKEGNVPYGRIYDVLQTLQLKGFVEMEMGSPKKFKSANPKIILKLILEREENKFNKFKEKVDEAIILIENPEKTPVLSIFQGIDAFYERMINSVKNTKKENLAIAGTFGHKKYPTITKVVLETVKKNECKCKIITPLNEKNKDKVKSLIKRGVKIKIFDIEGIRLVIKDRESVILSVKDEGLPYEIVGVEINNKNFAYAMAKMYDVLWEAAKNPKF